ncbi:hypothetical protein LOK49_LG15G00967 [Camellia lanceoleosa]|uniref:Uncharacterized protein n=1 Tax=Camellia lanceoleosa TaxID=1840588 RepID=A0ACC0F6J6_9ERIC|nr:hypothetical protein LOK49_LG15G00967 [Camellia lanceoleosa]
MKLGFMTLMYIFETYLNLQQHAALKLPTLPKTLEGLISQEKFEKSRAYSLDKSHFHFVHEFVTILMDSAILFFGVLLWFWKRLGDFLVYMGLNAENEIVHTLAFLASVMFWSRIWDFNLDRLRGHDESNPLEMGYGASNAGFMMKSYDELLKEASLASTKGFSEIYGVNFSMTHEDLIVFHNNTNKPTASHGPTTPECNNLPIGRPSSGLAFIKPKGYRASKYIQFTESSILVRGETSTVAIMKADMEHLAQNRGNAIHDKHIQYELSKTKADTKKQVKGRFVKASEAPDG